MAVAGGDGTYGYFYQDAPGGMANAPYTFGLWMKKDAAFTASTVELKLEWFDGANKLGEVMTNIYSQLDTTWRWVRVDGTSPSGTRTVRCTVWCGDITCNEGALHSDDAVLISASNRAIVSDARLVFDPRVDISAFHPRWELKVSLPSNEITSVVSMVRQDLDGDSDHDGMSDRHELYAGTDPENASSAFYFEALRASSPTGIELRWNSVPGRT